MYGVEENYLHTVNLDYYMPREYQEGVHLDYVPGTGVRDAVQGLYSNESLDPDDKLWDPYNVSVGDTGVHRPPMEEVKVLIPEGYRDVLSVDTTV